MLARNATSSLPYDERHRILWDMTRRERATRPEDLTRLFVERANAGDAEGLAELYAPDAVLGFPPGAETVGREAIRAVLEAMLEQVPSFPHEEPLPSLVHGDLALCATRSADGTGTRAQVARRQPDGSWLRIIDRPESRG
jgi:ketosteroid isomerase-like protein